MKAEWRKFAVFHEYAEFVVLGVDAPDRCTHALSSEITAVQREMLETERVPYFRMRLAFFRNLVPYCSAQPELYSPTDLAQFRANVTTLEGLVK
ncbi:hypothetical protein J4410_07100 [Candidatus Woesearchaeota archaeon]|nr:hypothetical protein [Candidatus Woesearchaeota archaeon]